MMILRDCVPLESLNFNLRSYQTLDIYFFGSVCEASGGCSLRSQKSEIVFTKLTKKLQKLLNYLGN